MPCNNSDARSMPAKCFDSRRNFEVILTLDAESLFLPPRLAQPQLAFAADLICADGAVKEVGDSWKSRSEV
jgi:hypothetical protein